jgi:glycosyltransferase involved in cell wall biosynthesis
MFDFIKYIQPGNYYRLVNQMPQAVLEFSENLNHVGYGSNVSEQLDQAYYLLQAGFIPKLSDQRSELQNQMVSSVGDNYIFLNRYFSKAQVFRVLILRILFFNNPILEVFGFLNALKFKRVKINSINYVVFNEFNSSLLKSKPLISVIVPTLNRYEYLKDVLADLEKQDYAHFEVIICDQSEPVNEAFYDGWNLNIQLIKQEEKALWLARNKCIKRAKGEYILLFDDDSRVESNWISNHLKCIDFFSVLISAGVTHTLVGGGPGKKHNYFHLSDVFDTGNAMAKREVFEKVGLFDRQFEKQRMGDSEFGLRSLLGGFVIVSNPLAQRIHLKVETGGLRQMGSWDAVRPKNILAPRPIPSVLYLIRKYFGTKESMFFLLKNIPQSYIPYRFKGNRMAKLMVYFFMPFWLPLAIFSSLKSWHLATLKLRQGSIIEPLS